MIDGKRKAGTAVAVVSVWVILVLAVSAAGCAGPGGFSFDVAADMRGYTPPEFPTSTHFVGVCEAIRDIGPGEFMLTPGDHDPPDRVRLALTRFFGNDYAWYPAVGNHEGDQPEYMAYLREYNAGGKKLPRLSRSGPPGAVETCYSFDHGNAHFIIINQYYDGTGDMATDGDVPNPLYDWLAADLAASDKPFIFVVGHEPTVVVPDMDNGRVRHQGDSLNMHGANNHRFWSLLRKHNVVAYFCGHTHNASVSNINGVWQIDCGHARGIGDPGAPSTFVKMYVESNSVRCEVYRRDARDGTYRRKYTARLR